MKNVIINQKIHPTRKSVLVVQEMNDILWSVVRIALFMVAGDLHVIFNKEESTMDYKWLMIVLALILISEIILQIRMPHRESHRESYPDTATTTKTIDFDLYHKDSMFIWCLASMTDIQKQAFLKEFPGMIGHSAFTHSASIVTGDINNLPDAIVNASFYRKRQPANSLDAKDCASD